MSTPSGDNRCVRRSGTISRRQFVAMGGAAATLAVLPVRARAASSKLIMKIAATHAEQENVYRAILRFKDAVEKRTNGQVEVQTYPNSALGSMRATFNSVHLGILEAGVIDAATPGNQVASWTVPELPYLFRDLDHVHRMLDGPVGHELNRAILDGAKVRTLAVYDTTFRKIFTRRTPIRSLADMRGLKIRVPEAQSYVRCMQLLGANPTPVAWGELYTALQMGVVDGFENKCEAAYAAKLHEQTKCAAYTGHIFVLNPLMCSERWFGGLPKDVQEILLDAARASLVWQRAEAPTSEKAFEQKMRDAGVSFTSPDVAPFQKAVEPLCKEYGEKFNVTDLIKRIREA